MKKNTIFIILFLFCSFAFAQDQEFEYDSRGKRDPFFPLIGNSNVAMEGTRLILNIEDINLQGITSDSTLGRTVVINDNILKEGDTLDALTIVKINEDTVIVTIQGKEYTIHLYDYNM